MFSTVIGGYTCRGCVLWASWAIPFQLAVAEVASHSMTCEQTNTSLCDQKPCLDLLVPNPYHPRQKILRSFPSARSLKLRGSTFNGLFGPEQLWGLEQTGITPCNGDATSKQAMGGWITTMCTCKNSALSGCGFGALFVVGRAVQLVATTRSVCFSSICSPTLPLLA